ncbi:MAG: RsmB/NOP family class I SAM-dependent RNA methyltransferase [Clostridiales bacterium]|jgi:16S rRNA C967 or C1407 C5-methylase (RsmB/RsmF family)/NOL1/NOP2/fmu family ribosome biogenesis protein|nr:RsmB/NOP family class I SAM-dependent RNA methyltransferase [Clostridiales bacterium]
MKFPEVFIDRMRKTLGDDYEAFEQSFDEPVFTGLRVNTEKISVSDFLELFPYPLKPIPWTKDGFYYNIEDPVTKHPYYHAGLYYIQEPSAMAPVNILEPSRGDVCIDLCAAPGGKSMQIAAAIGESGILVSNDINDSRIKAIVRNVEKYGLRNVVVINEAPSRIASRMGNCFDAVLVDAPCSGEGMFKKDRKAVKSWETFGPEECQVIQREIIDNLNRLTKPNSKIVYSTCTFSQMENEEQIKHLISDYNCFIEKPILVPSISVDGHMAHIWPHLHKGEGHFISSLWTDGTLEGVDLEEYESNDPHPLLKDFIASHFKTKALNGHFTTEKDRIYLKPNKKLPLGGIRVVREGLLVGELKKERFTPSQALALYLKKSDFEPIVDLPSDSINAIKYLKGETIHLDITTEGVHLVCTDGFPIGWAKINRGTLKNMYPVSWRMQ